MAEIYYKNANGRKIEFGRAPYYLQRATDLMSHKWEYTNSEYVSKIESFSMEFVEKEFTLAVLAVDDKDYAKALKDLHDVFDSDVKNLTCGRLYVGLDYLNCYIIECNQSSYDRRANVVFKPFKLIAESGQWIREKEYVSTDITAEGEGEEELGLDYPHDYPFDYKHSKSDTVYNESVGGMDFKMVIYGACEYPEVTIGTNVYFVETTLEASERLEIDSINKTVRKYDSLGNFESVFHLRDRDHYIFNQIPTGISSIQRNDSYDVHLTVYEYRSEPEWWT